MKQPPQQGSSTAEEMGTAEEVIKALLDYLVDPLLPLRPPSSPPLLSNQQKVAKQIHAVVLLYNYYQRKRHAWAEFLDFMSFCRLVVTLRPVLAAYISSTEIPEPIDSENLEFKLSVTEKAIEDACKISLSLDVSRDIPDVNEWVVSKVAVFLVNSSKERCSLLFSSLTDGVWSIYEKSIDHSVENQENQTKSRNLDKKKRKRRQSTGEPDLQQLAFSALKEARGIEQTHLKILEKHVTYSLDKEKTSVCCFIMECRSTNQEFEFSVRDTIESLQGPLVKKNSGHWTLTQLIEYYNVLPYAGILSSWFSRQSPLISSELSNASYESANAKVQEEVDIDVESDGTCDDANLPINKSDESDEGKSDYRNGSKRKDHIGLNGNLSGTVSDIEILPQRSNEESMATNSIEPEKSVCPFDKEANMLNGNLSGTVPDIEILPQRSNEESMATNVIEPKSFVCPFEEETNVKSLGKNLDDNVKIVQQTSKGRVPEEMCERVHSEISAIGASLEDTEKPCVKEIQPSRNQVDEEGSTSTNSMGEEVGTFNSFERPAKKVKSHEASESSLPCKTATNLLVLCSRKVLQLESSDAYVDDIQETRGMLTNEGKSTIISLLGDAIAESKLTSDERLAKEHDLTLCKSVSRCESNSDLLCSLQDSQLKSGHIDEDNSPGEGNLCNEISATIISQSADTDDVRSDKPDLKVISSDDLECGTTDNKLDPGIATKENSKCEKIDSALETDVRTPIKGSPSLPSGKGSDVRTPIKGSPSLPSGHIDEDNSPGEGNLRNEISATIISQSADTDDVRSDKPDLKVISSDDLECGTTDNKLDPGIATKENSKCEKIDSALKTDVRTPIKDSPSLPSGNCSDDSPLTCPTGKDEDLSTKSVIVYNAKRKKFRNHDARAPTGYENTEKETAKGEKSCNTQCLDKMEINQASVLSDLQDKSVVDVAIIPVESGHGASNHLLSMLALKETELSQTALGVLLQKKHELCRQQQEIQDQIALCDQSIQKILDGNENSLLLKIDILVKCCNDFLENKTEVQCITYNEGGGSGTTQLPRAETILKPFPSLGSACQEAVNRNANNCATAGQYKTSSNENIVGGVNAGEMDLKCSGDGTRFSIPPEMESAAAEITATGETNFQKTADN